MEKRVLLAVFLSFLVLYAYQAMFPAPKPVRKPQPAAATAIAGSAAKPAVMPPPGAEQQASPTQAPAPQAATPQGGEPAAAPAVAADVAEQSERLVVVDTSTVTATFSNRGGVVTSWKLKHYNDDSGQPVDLVPRLAADVPRPFSVRTEDPQITARLNGSVYRVTVDGHPAGPRVTVTQPIALVFEYRERDGIAVRKAFRVDPAGYVVKYSSTTSNAGRPVNPVLEWGPGLGDSVHIAGESSSFAAYVQRSQGILLGEDGKVLRLNNEGVAGTPSHQGKFRFAGIDDHYFIATLVDPGVARVQYQPQAFPLAGAPGQRELMAWSILFAQPPSGVRFFVGPKDFDVLETVDRPLVKAIHFGIWDFLAVPLLRALKWVDGYIGNYGWSIIILTILINLAMFPLRHKSVVSMRKMQEAQPHIKAIQDRYAKYKATDPERQKMNAELMALYKERGVNPASGCLPMLLTMPVLFAFYSLLSVAIEMRGAPFGLWIKDLSVHDPYYITPLIMAATMFWQQRLTPVADPTQARVMMLTPVMFLFFFLWAPSGLVIYWTTSNLLGIAQQTLTNRIIGAPVVKQVRPPAERKLKSAGAGKQMGSG